MWQHRWSIWSGVLGAIASCVAKVAVSNDPSSPLMRGKETWCVVYMTEDQNQSTFISSYVAPWLGTLGTSYVVNMMEYFQLLHKNNEEALIPELQILEVDWCSVFFLGPRILLFVSMLLMNAFMMAAFVKGMQHSGSLIGTSITTASNFATSALLGALVWKERFSSAWWLGFTTVLTGVLLLSSVQPPDEPDSSTSTSVNPSKPTDALK